MIDNLAKIRVVYDEWAFQDTHGGVSRMFAEIMKHLPKRFEWILTPAYTTNEYLRSEPFNLSPPIMTINQLSKKLFFGGHFPGERRICFFIALLLRKLLPCAEVVNYLSRQKILSAGGYDIYHIDAWDIPTKCFGKPLVTTVCDLIPFVVGGNSKILLKYKKLCSLVDHVIAISENTKRDLVKYCGVAPSKISVVYLGYNALPRLATSKIGWIDDLSKEPYVLYVGKRNGYKNFKWMVRAIAKFLRGSGKHRFRLFCTGHPFNKDELKLFEELGISNRVMQRFVSDEEMSELFARALCFIFPSKYEGFGIPILDAFSAGCPVLLSNVSCFPEVAGDAALYFDPEDDGSELCDCLELMMTDSRLRQALIMRGATRVTAFSWQKCATETARVYESVLEEWERTRHEKNAS